MRFLCLLLVCLAPPSFAAERVEIRRVPDGGLQPRAAVARDGTIHLVYYKGKAVGGDLFYRRSRDGGKSFSRPLRVNSEPGSAIAAGTIRGAQLALGKKDRVHVAWNGASSGGSPHGAPMLYARLDAARTAFGPQRNPMTKTRFLDGGGSVAADGRGNVFVVWHAVLVDGPKGEDARAVWVARSRDEGKTFSPERRANDENTGACGCCGLQAFADGEGRLYVLYRTATKVLHRDMHLLVSADRGASFRSAKVDSWQVPKCVMSLAAFHHAPQGVFAAWETRDDVFYGLIDRDSYSVPERMRAVGFDKPRKHPALASNARGEILLVWTEGTGWNRGGSLRWQLHDRRGAPISGQAGSRKGVPVWSFPAVFARSDETFVILY